MVEIPDTPAVETRLLRYLAATIAPKSASDAYSVLGSQFNLNYADRARRMANQAESHWRNRVRTAMNNLVTQGYAERLGRDEWSATKAGRDRINMIDNLKISL
jgi:restriction endonuclease Mrr